MKHIKCMLALFFVGATLALASCSDKDDDTNAQSSLVGTQWVATEQGEDIDDNDEVYTYITTVTISFTTATEGIFEMDYQEPQFPENNEFQSLQFTYTYTAPNGKITVNNNIFDRYLNFTIDGNTMTAVDEDGEAITFTRK